MMIIQALQTRRDSVTIDGEPLRDPRLSLRARGLLGTILSYPNGRADLTALIQGCPETEESVNAALVELIDEGYAINDQSRNAL